MPGQRLPEAATSRVALSLALALALAFAGRVLGQLVVFLDLPGASSLPPMRAWFSGLVPYPALLLTQVLILLAQGVQVVGWVRSGPPAPRPVQGRWLMLFAAAYAGTMLLRYAIANAWNGPGPEWWSNGLIPVVFHQVLAGYLAVWGWSLRQRRDDPGGGPVPPAAAAESPRGTG